MYLKWLDFRWPKDPLVNLLVAVMSLFFIITNGNKFNNEAVINTPIFPAPTMADMGPYPGVPGYSSFVAAIAMPSDGAVFVAPADITIFGTVASNISSVVRLDFYADGALLYSNRYANYAYTWKGVPVGEYSLTVSAVNSNGQTTKSLPVKITVFNPSPSGCLCPAKCGERTDIASPFSVDGVGEYCWETVSPIQYVNSVNVEYLLINGVDYKNCLSNQLPPKKNGRYFIYYKTAVDSGHFDMQ